MSGIENVSRRGFLKGTLSAGALVLSVPLVPHGRLWAEMTARGTGAALPETPVDRAALHPSVFLGIETDGTVFIIAARSEMGTQITTGLPRVVADELDADWTRVKIRQAVGDARYGSQDTDGSHSIRSFFDAMREAGATARAMLIAAAAARWGVPVAKCSTALHAVVYRPGGELASSADPSPAAHAVRSLGYGELAAAAAKLPVPKKQDLKFKTRSAWRYIGKGASAYNLRDLCTGRAVYGMDARRDGMLYASVEHPPVVGGTVASYDDKETLRVPGVRQTVALPPLKLPAGFQPLGGIAVVADNTWAAFQGRKKLKASWVSGPNGIYNSDPFKRELKATARRPGKVARNIGDVDAEFAKGGKTVEAEYYAPHLAHASMEPPVALADFHGGKLEAWVPTQDPQGVQEFAAKALGIPKNAVTVHVTLLGGAFGRKSFHDYSIEAALLSKKTGRPVKVVWTREDDIKFDYYHSVAAMYLKAALDAHGKPTAWLQRSVFPPIGSTFAAGDTYGGAGELGMGWTDVPFDVPNLRVENGAAPGHVRIGWLRSVANIYHAFGVQSFAAELAVAVGRDPVEYLLDLLGPPRIIDMKGVKYPNMGASYAQYPIDTGRLRRVTELAAEKSGWGKRKLGKGSGMGFAVHRSFLTYVATVVEVEVNDRGEIRIPRVDTVVDAGTVVNPASVRSQFEGAAVFGASLALMGEITATNGAINQSNFFDYPVARIHQAPYQTNIHIVPSDAPPAGAGEPGVPPFAPALCNAIFAATGKRVRELPIAKTKLV